jgi:hypothetical protein
MGMITTQDILREYVESNCCQDAESKRSFMMWIHFVHPEKEDEIDKLYEIFKRNYLI